MKVCGQNNIGCITEGKEFVMNLKSTTSPVRYSHRHIFFARGEDILDYGVLIGSHYIVFEKFY
jgi:hypothetical protein